MLTTFALMSLCLVFGGVIGISIRNKDEKKVVKKDLSPVEELIEHIKWLPIFRLTHERRDEKGFPTKSIVFGSWVPVLEFEGGIKVVAEDKPINSAFLDYKNTRIGLLSRDREALGIIFKNRVAEMALTQAEVKLLEPHK